MGAMSLDNQIYQCLSQLKNEDKKSVLSYIKSFLTENETAKRLTREDFIIQYNKEIDDAEREINEGHIISQEDLEKESETW